MTGWIGLDRGRARMRRLVTGLAVASLGLGVLMFNRFEPRLAEEL